jgi:hypothetical protein
MRHEHVGLVGRQAPPVGHNDNASGYPWRCVALTNAELDAVLGKLNPADNPHILIAVA